jgi:putative DNA primase/helicase
MVDPVKAFRAAILSALGQAPDHIEPGRLQRFSTSRRAGDKAGWSKLFADQRYGVFGDFRTGVTEAWRMPSEPFKSASERKSSARQHLLARERHDEKLHRHSVVNASLMREIWANTLAVVDGDPVARYLHRRGLNGRVPACLRHHPSLPYWQEGYLGNWPAMVAPLTAPDGRVLALHRTYLTADGHKAPVANVKKLTRAVGPVPGACIALHEPLNGALGVAEGIETAQAAYLASGLPTVAAYCANGLATFQWPKGLRTYP